MPELRLKLTKDKTTKNAIRFAEDSDDHPVNIYLTKERVIELGNPEVVSVTIEKES